MLLINRDTDYAVRILLYMFKSGENILSADDISSELEIPYAFVRKILQELSNENILMTHRGRGGGFSLDKPVEDVSVLKLIKIFQKNVDLSRCVFKSKICPNMDDCVLRGEIKDIEKDIIRRMKNLTLKDLLR